MNEVTATRTRFRKVPLAEFSREGLEAAGDGFAVYDRMTRSLFAILVPSLTIDQEDILAKWRREASGKSSEVADLFVDTLQVFGAPLPGGFEWWQDVVRAWKGMNRGAVTFPSRQCLREASDNLLALWMENSETFYHRVLDCTRQFADERPPALARAGDSRRIYDGLMESSQRYYETRCRARYEFIREQGAAYFEFLDALLPGDREDPYNGVSGNRSVPAEG